jgi:hypothetical protein
LQGQSPDLSGFGKAARPRFELGRVGQFALGSASSINP